MQEITNPELFKSLVAAMPLSFLEGMARALPSIYADALAELEASAVIDAQDAVTLLPHYRRAMMETRFRREAIDAGLSAIVETTKNETARYSSVTANQIVLTASYVPQPNHQARFAAFRSDFATLNELLEQGDFFGFADQKSTDKKIYCILLYGGAATKESVNTFMEFAFPSPEGGGYVEHYPFAQVLIAARALHSEKPKDQIDTAHPTVKKQPKKGTDGGGEE
jgi:hypothetical protein